MTIIKTDTSTHAYSTAAEFNIMRPRVEVLVDELVSSTFSTETFIRAFSSGMTEIASMLRAVPGAEGRLLERGIALIAGLNPQLLVLTENLRLPVTKTAMELVEMNDPALFKSLSLDADSGGRKGYTPDLLILNRETKVAHLVDVKRSLGSYEASRIAELKHRMLAAALVVPDLLYKEHRRLSAKEVRVVILNASNHRSDIDGGVWPLTHLDHLLEIAGAGECMAELRGLFETRIAENWSAALRSVGRTSGNEMEAKLPRPGGMTDEDQPIPVHLSEAPSVAGRLPVQIGFAQAPRPVAH